MRTGSSPALHPVLILGLVLAVPAAAAAQPVSDAMPRVIRFNGTIPGAVGQTPVTIRLYRGQTDEAPIWSEEQVVEADATGRYSVLLGSGSPEGLPLDLFVSADARWLGVQAAGQAEQAAGPAGRGSLRHEGGRRRHDWRQAAVGVRPRRRHDGSRRRRPDICGHTGAETGPRRGGPGSRRAAQANPATSACSRGRPNWPTR